MTERPFEALGLSAEADRAYPLLVATRGVAVAELARQTGLPEERAGAVCAELADRGLARLGLDDRWYPLPPHQGLLPLLSRAQEQLVRGRELLDRLGVEYQRVHEGHRVEEVVQAVQGAEAVRMRLDGLGRQAREELLVFARGRPDPGEPGPAGEPALAGVSTIRRRVVVERPDVEKDPEGAGAAAEGLAPGANVRVVDRLPVRMWVADRTVALVPLAAGAAPPDPVMLVIGASGLLDALVLLFESVWAGAVPLARADTGRSGLHDRILAMLVMGSTDAAMARSLGVAVRTVQRRIAAMQRAAGVDNRIQLVWHAARNGWLD